jgi:hypothetical protein
MITIIKLIQTEDGAETEKISYSHFVRSYH